MATAELKKSPTPDEQLEFLCREARLFAMIESTVLRAWKEEEARGMPPVCADLFGEIYDLCQHAAGVTGRAMMLCMVSQDRQGASHA